MPTRPRQRSGGLSFAAVSASLLLAVLFGLAAPQSTAAQESDVDFARDIKPILARRCFSCHGPGDAEGGLQLHKRESALAELDSGLHAVVPGKPDASAILARISSDDESERMPPEGKPLTHQQIELVRRWISSGADWETHWAFQPPRPPTPPAVEAAAWVVNPIDAFVSSKLAAQGLRPSPPADRVALLRRAYHDLLGLPPTPQQIQAFLADSSADAFEKVIDQLLESPRYGERWGRHWLDLVRFAETNSFERDGRKPHAWRYRDYVIRSLNDDKPYDQFIREQLAGDELPEVTNDSIIATGFYRLGIWDDEPADRLQARYDGLDDIVRTTSETFLGLSIGCARCHDHKIDPVPQKDYYSMLAFFQGITPMSNGGPQVETPIFADAQARQDYQNAVQALRQRQDDVQAELTALEQEFRRLAGGDMMSPDLDDLEYRFYRDSWDTIPDFDNLKAETVSKLDRPYFDIRPATRQSHFGFVFTGVLKVPADGEYTFSLDSDDGTRLTLDGQMILEYDGIHGVGSPRTATVTLKQGRLPIRLDYFQREGGKGLEVTWSGPEFQRKFLSATTSEGVDITKLSEKNAGELIKSLGEKVLGRKRTEQHKQLQQKLEALKRERVPMDQALAITEVGPQAPETSILLRGNPHVPGDKVQPGFPSILDPSLPEIPPPAAGAKTSGRRLALANWIASPDNMLTSRVMANRLWQHHFGRGIVRSPNNFGHLGDLPTHPELLDWLAAELINNGWRLKSMHKLIMLSNTYQMSSAGNPEGLAMDPDNNLFWRFNMRRMSAEEIRDSLLAVTGRLNTSMYGPGFYPEISQEVLAGQSNPGSGWGKSSPDEQARRSVYIHVKRSLITPILANFDSPETDASCEARFATTHAGQALGMLNGEFMHQQAAHLAERLRREVGDDRVAQVRHALELTLCRKPRADELERGMTLIDDLQQTFGVSPDKALDLYCLVTLNLNEFMYLD